MSAFPRLVILFLLACLAMVPLRAATTGETWIELMKKVRTHSANEALEYAEKALFEAKQFGVDDPR
ncbi:MAG: hypothetical protein K2Z81_06335 [Cyanobacteria bacterium]|nr:hypothetical protein [Cyanobacteriota bacterium]